MLTTKLPFALDHAGDLSPIARKPVDEVKSAESEVDRQNTSGGTELTPKPPKGFRPGYGEHAAQIANQIREFAATGVGAVWQIAAHVAEMRSRLNRSEWRVFVASLLEWAGSQASKYLDIARTFQGFDFSALSGLEPFTLLKLRTKKYAPVVERLREEAVITPLLVQELIKELLPKQPRKKNQKVNSGDVALERHANALDGTFYWTLKGINLSDRVGSWLEAKLEYQTLGQILAQAAEMPPPSDISSQLEELQKVVENERILDAENRRLLDELQKRDRRIAELEAKLQESMQAEPEETQPTESIHFSTWEEVATAVECDAARLINIVKDWGVEKKQSLVNLLSEYLETGIETLERVAWAPKKLLDKALSTLSYTVHKIGGANNLVDEPKIDYIRGCSFVSLKYPGTKHEQWIFSDKNNLLYPVFGRTEFHVEKF